MTDLEKFFDHKYINLQTFRRNGEPVNTPVWFVIFNDKIYVITREFTGKVKRIRINNQVKIAPCSLNGELKGDWVVGKVNFVSEIETRNVIKLVHKKYGLWSKIVGIFTSKKGRPIGLSIDLN